MEWGDIRVFLGVARVGQMAGATRSLSLDHSTISRRIARLEEKMGVTLFDRAGRRLSLTKEGARLLEAAEKVESIIISEVQSLGESRKQIAGRVRIGTSVGFGAHYLAGRLPRLTAAFPGLEIELMEVPRTYSLGMREVDIAIVMDRPEAGDIRFKKLTSYSLAVYGSANYFETRNRPPNLEAFRDHRWCGFISELLYTTELDMLTFNEISITPEFRTMGVTAHLEAVRSGEVLSILPCYIGDIEPNFERVLPELAWLERTYWIAVHRDQAEAPRVRAVIDEIERWVREDRTTIYPMKPGGSGAD
jgi:DNA-binding transcriptional LysR family regulator